MTRSQVDKWSPVGRIGTRLEQLVAFVGGDVALELGHRLGVAERAAPVVGVVGGVVRCAHDSRLSTSCTTLAAVPSAKSVRSRSPVLSAAARFTTCPSRSRVSVYPRSSTRVGS